MDFACTTNEDTCLFTFPYKTSNSKDSTNIVRSSELFLLRNGTALLFAQLDRHTVASSPMDTSAAPKAVYWLSLYVCLLIDSPSSFHMFTDKSCGLLVQSSRATSIVSTAEAP